MNSGDADFSTKILKLLIALKKVMVKEECYLRFQERKVTKY